MKKAIILLCIAMGLMSCAKEILESENVLNEGVPMTFNVTVLDTKASKTTWAEGDKIYVFFNGLESKYLILENNGSTWTNTSGGGTLLSTDFDGLITKKLAAVHFPVAVDVAYADSKFSFTSGGKPVYTYYLYETGKDYTVDGTTVNATLSLAKPDNMVQIHVAGIQASVENYTFGGPLIKPVACTSVGIEGTINENELDAGERVSGFADSDGGVFAARLVYPGIQMFYRFNLADNNVIYTLTRTKALTAGKMYNFPAPTEIDNDKWRITAVNLGIKVGDNTLYWAKWNLGADSETYSPEYFSWGEATGSYWPGGKTNFFWDTYAWWDSDSHSLTKYCNNSSYGKNGYTDALTTLEKEDDAAFVTLGGKWRMPTDSEFQALMSLEKQWVTNYNNTGHSGYTFTGNGQTIFLTSALHWCQTSQSGSGGYYWSSSLYTYDPTRAMCLHFGSSIITRDWMDRSFGLSVRPVSE